MEERILLELPLLRSVFPGVEYKDRWILVPRYSLPPEWSLPTIPIVSFIRDGYPGVGPYGIHVPSGLRCRGTTPQNYTEPASSKPPFPGEWGFFSWEAAAWHATADPTKGHNLVNWVQGFAERFREGI
jgi:hypothetical protein